MNHRLTKQKALLFAASFFFCASAQAVDAGAANDLIWSNNCAKCHHSTDKKDKEGSPYKEIAKKYRGDANAEAKLFEHLTTGPRVKAPDGSEDDHRIVRGNKAKIENLVKWILAH